MAITQSAAVFQLIAFVDEIRNDAELMAALKSVPSVEEFHHYSPMVAKLPFLNILDGLLCGPSNQPMTAENMVHSESCPAEFKKLSIAKLLSVIQKAEALNTNAAVLTEMGGCIMVNPVSMAMLAQAGIGVSIIHDVQNYLDEQSTYMPQVVYVTEHFVL